MDYISAVVKQLIEKHETRDPERLCRYLGIKIRYKDCDNLLKAYFITIARIKNIVINSRIGESMRLILLAHELGHAVLHSELAVLKGFQEFELFDSTIPAEYEANLFAAELLIEDNGVLELMNNDDKSFFGVARELNVPTELLDFKFRVMKRKGYRLEAPYIANGD
ncbi:MAG: ImmA/IrrE family metallo-endopeptidase, partial [Oscillospiraceae bacterium]|nr:ImmA/IrrE family metallo-endopeptidase [Oscillospiraceae bacterium]